jgi:hypothetical protein
MARNYRYTVSKSESPLARLFLSDRKSLNVGLRDQIEICPDGWDVVQQLGQKVWLLPLVR